MKILVCGGNKYRWRGRVDNVLDRVRAERGISLLIHGAEVGAATLAENWAKSRQVPYVGVPAKWQEHGNRTAGAIRNSEMLKEWQPDAVVAFPGEEETADMVVKAKASGISVWEIPDDEE